MAGPKDFKRTLGEGSSGGGVQGCQKKLGQKSDISRVLGLLLGRRGMGMGLAGRLQSVALIGNRGGSQIFSSGPDGTTRLPRPLCQRNVIEILIVDLPENVFYY